MNLLGAPEGSKSALGSILQQIGSQIRRASVPRRVRSRAKVMWSSFSFSRPRARGRPKGPGRRQFAGRTNANPTPTERHRYSIDFGESSGRRRRGFNTQACVKSVARCRPSSAHVSGGLRGPFWDQFGLQKYAFVDLFLVPSVIFVGVIFHSMLATRVL